MRPTVRATELIIDGNYADRARKAIAGADSDIRICAYDWRWYDGEPDAGIQRLNVAIMRAIHRGLNVRALVNSEENYMQLKGLGVDCKFVGSEKMLHVKGISIQNDCLLLGSHNMTKRANTRNYECSVVIFEPEIIMQFNTYFYGIWEYAQGGL